MKRLIVIHSSETDEPCNDSFAKITSQRSNQPCSIYHYFIRKDGMIEQYFENETPIPISKDIVNSAISICLSGNLFFTDEQIDSARYIISELVEEYNLEKFDVVAHSEVCDNSCRFKMFDDLMRF